MLHMCTSTHVWFIDALPFHTTGDYFFPVYAFFTLRGPSNQTFAYTSPGIFSSHTALWSCYDFSLQSFLPTISISNNHKRPAICTRDIIPYVLLWCFILLQHASWRMVSAVILNAQSSTMVVKNPSQNSTGVSTNKILGISGLHN